MSSTFAGIAPDFSTLAIIICAIFLACLVRSVLGFGDGIVSMSVLTMAMTVVEADGIATITGGGLGLYLSFYSRGSILEHIKNLYLHIILFSLGTVLGVYVIEHIDLDILQLLLGFFVFFFPFIKNTLVRFFDKCALLTGILPFLAGITGSTINMNGPLLLAYCSIKKWDRNSMFSILQLFLLVGNALNFLLYSEEGLLSKYSLLSLFIFIPSIIITAFIGKKIRAKFDTEKYTHILNLAFIGLGLYFIISSYISLSQ